MPELPEVQTVVETLRPVILGRRIKRFEVLRADFAAPEGHDWPATVGGRRIVRLERRAKRIIFELDDGNRFYAHLGMTGRLLYGPSRRARVKHTHVCFRLEEGEVHFVDARRFGQLRWIGQAAGGDELGPEPLTMRAGVLARRLASTRRAIKTALLDQKLIAGLGNIYVDEALFAAGIYPLRPAAQLTGAEAARLNSAIKSVLHKAIRHRGSTLRDYVDANGSAGAFKRLHEVYGREGDPCSRCSAKIRRIVVGGRSTHFCPRCQRRAGTRRPLADRKKREVANGGLLRQAAT